MDDTRGPSKGAENATTTGVELDPDQLSPEALRGLLEEYVTREGTDYGSAGGAPGGREDWSLEDKVADVTRQLETGEARIVFDLEQESASIVSSRELAEQRPVSPDSPPVYDADEGMNQDWE